MKDTAYITDSQLLFTVQGIKMTDEILTQEQAAELLGYSVHTLEDMRSKKRGPVFSRPENGKIFYLKSDLLDWVKLGRKENE